MKPHKQNKIYETMDRKNGNNDWMKWSEWVEILWVFMKFFFRQMLKVSAFYLEKQKYS